MVGAQASNDQLEKIQSYLDIGQSEGAKILISGERVDLGGELSGGYYVQPTIFEGDNAMRIFQEEIFGPVVAVTQFDDYDDAIRIANDTPCTGLGAEVWTRDVNTAYRAGPGSSPMCYQEGEFRTGASDVLLARLAVEGIASRLLTDAEDAVLNR